MAQVRRWCGTLNSSPECGWSAWVKQASEKEAVAYIVAQVERGEQTEHEHLQFYMQFSRSVRLNWLKEKISAEAHWEPARGDAEKARAYCMKQDTRVAGPWEYGKWAKQGQTRGLVQAAEMITQGAPMREVAEQFPTEYIRHHKGMQSLWAQVRLQHRKIDMEVGPEIWVFYGPTGTGKSMEVYHRWPDAYRKPANGKWWDGYQGEETVVFEDFKGSAMALHDLQLVLDKYPLNVEVKGGFIPLSATRYVFTTNTHPYSWYEADKERTIERRIQWWCEEHGRLIYTGTTGWTAADREATPAVEGTRQGFADFIPSPDHE